MWHILHPKIWHHNFSSAAFFYGLAPTDFTHVIKDQLTDIGEIIRPFHSIDAILKMWSLYAYNNTLQSTSRVHNLWVL